MDYADVVGDAYALVAMAHLEPREPHSINSICVGLTGMPPLLAPHIGSEGRLTRVNGQVHIIANSRLSPERLRWVIGHELAHVYYARIGREEGALEERCDLVGAILCAPDAVVKRAVRAYGPDPIAVARYIGTTQAIALLRIGEMGIVDGVALVTRRRFAVRGSASWMSREKIVRAIKRGGDGATVVHITDAPRHVGLILNG